MGRYSEEEENRVISVYFNTNVCYIAFMRLKMVEEECKHPKTLFEKSDLLDGMMWVCIDGGCGGHSTAPKSCVEGLRTLENILIFFEARYERALRTLSE